MRTLRYYASMPSVVLTDPDVVDSTVERLAERAQDAMDRLGYRFADPEKTGQVTIHHETDSFGHIKVELEVTVRARWDGVWGDLRAALAEDGLLDARDAADRPSLPSHPPVGTVCYAMDPAIDRSDPAAVAAIVAMVWDGTHWKQLPTAAGRIITDFRDRH